MISLTESRTPVALVVALFSLMTLTSCASKILEAERSQEILKNEEFEQAIQVSEIPPAPGTETTPSAAPVSAPNPEPQAPSAKGKQIKKTKSAPQPARKGKVAQASAVVPTVHEPDLEDGEGFVGRRPIVDPFRVGERVTLEMSYFGVTAGDVTIEVRPFVKVNGRKSYFFMGRAITTSIFAMFYAVDDWFETYVDYETLVPYSYALHVKESKQLRETRSIFNWKTGTATWWDKKINSDKKVEENKKTWDIPPFSQNVFSAAYYVRAFQLRPGKKIAYRIAHEGENLIITIDVIRKERIKTPIGELNTLVLKPKIELDGVFKPVGDIFMWVTDDDRKMLVKVESKIKIGSIVGIVKKLEPGIQP